jgi:DNA topoisomerase IA
MKVQDFGTGGIYCVGRVLGAVNATYEKCQTEPPERYTQSDLIDDMMAAHKCAQDDQERAVLRQIDGLGTARTRESTITGLIDRGFLELRKSRRGRKSQLVPTTLAREVVRHLPEMLTSVGTTAKWELAFRLIEQAKASVAQADQFLAITLERIVAEAKAKGRIAITSPASDKPPTRHFGRTPASARASTGRSVGAAGVGRA